MQRDAGVGRRQTKNRARHPLAGFVGRKPMKTAIVTGGTRGIGRGVVHYLVSKGYYCLVTYGSSVSDASKLEDELPSQVELLKVDHRFPKLVEETIGKTLRDLKIDVLVNCVSNDLCKTVGECSLEEWTETVSLILTNTFVMAKLCLPGMRERKFGRIINFGAGSYNYLTGNYGLSPYGICKGAIILLTKELALEEIRNGITANIIGPGSTRSAGPNPEEKRIPIERLPLGRRIEIEEIVNAVDFLLRPESGVITGQIINVCGGYSV